MATAMPAPIPEPNPELFILIVTALGTPVEQVQTALEKALMAVHYKPMSVRISDYLKAMAPADKSDGMTDTEWLMDLGDDLREKSGPAAAAALAVSAIRSGRREAAKSKKKGEKKGVDLDRASTVTIIRSAKRQEEIDFFRNIYGSRLLVLGVSQYTDSRRETLIKRLTGEQPDAEGSLADRLLKRDEQDDENPNGQGVRKAFQNADAFIWLRDGHDSSSDVQRIVNLWFGDQWATPTRDEQAMFHAKAAQYRSAAAGRQVGAAVIDNDGEILVTGTNDVPKPGGGQYWSTDTVDFRDFKLLFETNDQVKREVVRDALHRLKEHGWLAPEKTEWSDKELLDKALQSGGPLKGARVTDLIEFGRIVHAEMAAICTAARRGTPLRGASLYTTTYPCHECARLIIAAGITKVVFIDPYPKSQVNELFKHLVSHVPGNTHDEQVQILPFEGIAPSLFATVFRMNDKDRERTDDGEFKKWVSSPPTVRAASVNPLKDEEEALRVAGMSDFGSSVSRRQAIDEVIYSSN